MNTDKIISKVRKLIALAENAGATEGERDNAMRQAHKFLAKYNLSMTDLTETVEATGDTTIKFKSAPWSRQVANAIGKLYFCSYLYVRGTHQHMFIGKESNMVTAIEMTNFIRRALDREAIRFKNKMGGANNYATDFLRGAADAIWYKVEEIIENRDRPDTADSKALVVVYNQEADLNAEYIKKMFGKLQAGKRRKRTSTGYAGYAAGKAYAKTLNLNTQLN